MKIQDSAVSYAPTFNFLSSILFLASALVGVWAAYDRAAAWPRFGGLALGLGAAGAIGWAGRRWGDRALRIASAGCAGLAAAVALYFLLTTVWAAGGAGKFALLHGIGLWIQAHRPALPLTEDINGNVAAGALAILIPLGLAGVIRGRGPAADGPASTPAIGSAPQGRGDIGHPSARTRGAAAVWAAALRVAWGLALGIAAFGLILTASRGAWGGLAIGGACAGGLAWRARRLRPRIPEATVALGLPLALAAASALIFAAAVAAPGFAQALGGVGTSAMSRAALWRDGLALAGDTPFTGAGLGSTMMVYSTYALMLHVGFIFHSHNLFLQIALEQGLPGLITFAALLGAGLMAAITDSRRRWGLAAAAALVALVVHGTVDAGLYVSRLAPVLFLPLGFAWAGCRGAEVKSRSDEGPIRFHPRSPASHFRIRYLVSALTLTLTLALALAFALLPSVRAAFQANLGAVAQERAELGVYEWPQWPIQDALRRSAEVALGPAAARFEAALALDPANVTANRRLGQIALSRGEEAAARQRLEAAYAVAPDQHATRLLLGESYAIAGEIDRAAALWQGLDLSQGQIALRAWWYAHLGQPDHAARIAAAAEAAQ